MEGPFRIRQLNVDRGRPSDPEDLGMWSRRRQEPEIVAHRNASTTRSSRSYGSCKFVHRTSSRQDGKAPSRRCGGEVGDALGDDHVRDRIRAHARQGDDRGCRAASCAGIRTDRNPLKGLHLGHRDGQGKSSGSKQYDVGSWRNRKKGRSSRQDEVGSWKAGME